MPKDSEHLTLLPPGPSEPIQPPSVPAGLTEAEAKLWAAVIEAKPSDWFDDSIAPILREYVRAACTADSLAGLIAAAGPGQLKPLLDLRDREARRAAAFATKLRMTPQSRYTSQAAATASKRAKGKRPWRTTDEPGAS